MREKANQPVEARRMSEKLSHTFALLVRLRVAQSGSRNWFTQCWSRNQMIPAAARANLVRGTTALGRRRRRSRQGNCCFFATALECLGSVNKTATACLASGRRFLVHCGRPDSRVEVSCLCENPPRVPLIESQRPQGRRQRAEQAPDASDGPFSASSPPAASALLLLFPSQRLMAGVSPSA